MCKKNALLLAFMAAFMMQVNAETVKWLVMPEYNAISYFSETVFKCKKDGKCQLVGLDGEELLPYAVDSVTCYSEGYALALDKIGTRYKVIGFFSEMGQKFSSMDKDYYTGDYPFFSEGLLPVSESSDGLYGYIDVNGRIVVPFKYRKARPFIQGWASVEPPKRLRQNIYIDKNGNTLTIHGFHNGEIVIGSSFNEAGRALVAHYGNENAVIGTDGEMLGEYVRKGNKPPIRFYDFAFDENGDDYVPVLQVVPSFDSHFSVFSENGLYGYVSGEKQIVPAQFTQAGLFANGRAIVEKNGKYGVLSLVKGEFSSTLKSDNNNAKNGKEPAKYTYTLQIPSDISQQAEVRFDAGDGNLRPENFQKGAYTFIPLVENGAREFTIRAQVLVDGLLLWNDEITEGTNNVQLTIEPPFCVTEFANDKDIVTVKTVVTNDSDSEVFVSAYFSAKFAEGSKNTTASKVYSTAKIPSGEQKEFSVDLKVIESEDVKVVVSVSANKNKYGHKSSVIAVKKFF